MATTTTNFGWDIPQSTDLVKDGATAIAALGQDIDTAFVDLKGGTTGQVLAKASGTDLDFSWVAVDPLTILDAKGDLISATAADTPARVAVGTNGQVLTADSSTSTGLKWSTPTAGGKVLQVVQGTYATATLTTSSTFANTGLTASITPTASTSKILVMVNHAVQRSAGSAGSRMSLKLVRNSTDIATAIAQLGYTATDLRQGLSFAYSYLDSPATTSSTTYKTQFANQFGSGDLYIQPNSETCTIVLMEIGA